MLSSERNSIFGSWFQVNFSMKSIFFLLLFMVNEKLENISKQQQNSILTAGDLFQMNRNSVIIAFYSPILLSK